MLKAREGRYWLQPVHECGRIFGLKALKYALPVALEKKTSGPKGHEDRNVYAGDKSPAYPVGEFLRSLTPVPNKNEFSRGL
jgi:hypothetical protein